MGARVGCMQKQGGHWEEDPVTRGMQERGAGEGEE